MAVYCTQGGLLCAAAKARHEPAVPYRPGGHQVSVIARTEEQRKQRGRSGPKPAGNGAGVDLLIAPELRAST